jgi:hypothetical protein
VSVHFVFGGLQWLRAVANRFPLLVTTRLGILPGLIRLSEQTVINPLESFEDSRPAHALSEPLGVHIANDESGRLCLKGRELPPRRQISPGDDPIPADRRVKAKLAFPFGLKSECRHGRYAYLTPAHSQIAGVKI